MKLKELSAILNLSQTTVSRALNGYPEVNAETRERVLQVAAKYNYRPNRQAASLATGRTMAIGHVLPIYSRNEVVNPIFAEFISGASQTYNQHGYELMVSIIDAGKEEETYRSMVNNRTVDGVILHMPTPKDPRIPLLNSIGLPFVMHGRDREATEPYSWIDVNNEEAFRRATQLLIDLGHRRIALINGQEIFEFAISRRRGYTSVLESNAITVDESIMTTTSMTETHGYDMTRKLLSLADPPTAFLASSYILGLGINRALYEFDLKPGKDVSIIIHDDELSYFHNAGDNQLFTATRSSVRTAGVHAASMLLEKIKNPDSKPQTCLLDAPLTIGQSTGPLNH